MVTLIILAYNEEENIELTISNYINEFEEIIIVNDGSKDNTANILSSYSSKQNIKIINNEKNLGAGISFEIGISEFLKSNSDYLIKIDGDNQFNKEDVLKIKKTFNSNHFDYIKCDRFWSGGINGQIPLIRYFGNAFASILIKFSSGNWHINDPLNGLIGLSKKAAKKIKLPKLFYKYGYPFFIANFICKLGSINKYKIGQYKNIVTYGKEKSYLKPLNMFFKLIYFSIQNYYSKIKEKIYYSEYQYSSILDILSNLILILSFFSLQKFIRIRYFNLDGPQSSWFILFILFVLISLFFTARSQRIENNFSKINYQDIL